MEDTTRASVRGDAVDGLPATAVLLGLILDGALGWWWADPAAFVQTLPICE